MKSTRIATEPFILSEQNLAELVLDEMDAAIVICDTQMNVVLANPAAHKLKGGDPVGMPFDTAFPMHWAHPEKDAPGNGAFSLEPVFKGEVLQGRVVLDCDSQAPREVQVRSASYHGPQEEVLCCIVSMMDVTALEMEQQRVSNILRAVVEGTTDAIFVKDTDGRFLMINPAGAAAIGLTVDEVIGKTTDQVMDAETARRLTADDRRVMSSGVPEVVETELPSPRGRRMFQAVKTPYRNRAGAVIGTIGVSRDMTELRQAQEALVRQATLLDLSPDALIVRDFDGTITFWSHGAAQLYGWTDKEALGQISHVLFQTQFLDSESSASQQNALQVWGHWDGELEHHTRDGTKIIVASRQLTQYDHNGAPSAVLEINEDITERKASERTQQFLVQATNELTASLDFEATLEKTARLAVPLLADWCSVHILMEDGIIRRLAFAHTDPAVIARVTARPQQYALDENAKHLVPHVLRTGETELFNQVPDSVLQEAARDQAHLETLRQLGMHAYLCVPLQARGRTLGTVTFAMSDSGRIFGARDVELAHELVRRAGLAADNARLYQESQVAQARLQIVAEASNELFLSLDYQTRMQSLADHVVPRFADWCIVNLVQPDGSIELTALSHVNPDKVAILREWVTKYPILPNGTDGTPYVIRTGKPVWVPDISHRIGSPDQPAERELYWQRLNICSYIIVPLVARERVLGALTFVTAESGRRFTFQDMLTGEEIARRAAVALENANLYAQEQHARREAEENALRISALQNVTASLATALTPRQVAQNALEHGMGALNAHAGNISLLTGDKETIEIIEAQGYDPAIVDVWRSFPITNASPIAAAIRTGETVLLQGQEQLRARYPDVFERQNALIGKAWAAIPLVVEQGVIGALGLTFAEERVFDADDRAFMNALAQQSAQAMERAQFFQAERAARATAEQNAARVFALQRITAALGTALTREQVAEVVLSQGTQALNAQGGLLTRLSADGQTVQVLSSQGYPAGMIQPQQEFPIDARLAIAEVVRTGEPLVFESVADLIAHYPERTIRPQAFAAWMFAPLEFEGRILGGMTLAFTSPRKLSQADRAFAVALGQQCAQALERARLFESELTARRVAESAAQRSEWLTKASHVLAGSLNYETTLAELAQLVVSELADWCTIDMAKGDGTAEQLILTHRDPVKLQWAKDYGAEIRQYFEPDWNAPRGLPNVLRTGKAEIYYDVPIELLKQAAKNEVQFEILKNIGYSSVMIVPLKIQDKTLGAITMANTDSGRHFTDDDLAFAELFAERAAVAIENASLYRELQTLNSELEERVAERTFELSEAYQELSKEVVERTRAEETTGALLRISNKLNSTLDIETSLDVLIQEAMGVINGNGGFAGLRTGEGMKMQKYYAAGKSVPFEYIWSSGKGLPGWVLQHGAPYVTNDAQHDPVVTHDLPFKQGVRSAVCTPILDSQGHVIGFFEVLDKLEGASFTDADVQFLMALSPIASIAIENAQAYQKIANAESAVQDSYAQLRALTARLQTIREEERTDIARELHDELGQALTALKMDLASLLVRLPKRSKKLQERVQAMTAEIDVTIKAVRRMSSQLRPGMLDDLGLGPSIEWYGQEFQTRTNIEVETTVPDQDLPLDQQRATALFRIFQETLTNVARHANATRVQATLEVEDDAVKLHIADNGQGIDLAQARVKRSLGLLGMRERAEMIQGTLEIQGEPGKGTTVMVRIPFQPSSADTNGNESVGQIRTQG